MFLVAAMAAIGMANAASMHLIGSVTLNRQSLNVAAGEIVTLTVEFARSGVCSIAVVDRDGYPVRDLANAQTATGPVSFGWDGRDDDGQLVPDEAYSFKIDWRGPEGTDTYFPANAPVTIAALQVRSYNRRTATLTYALPVPSRVHVQAGTSIVDPKTKTLVGSVMKTVVNREPRSGGTIAEHWNGYDESGLVFIPDLEDFVVAIAASPLPENAVVTFGNRQRRFVETLNTRRGASLFTHRGGHEHHAGLPSADDVSPALAIQPLNAVWSAADHAWIMDGNKALRLRLSVKGPTAAAFRAHPATVELFVDGRRIGEPSSKTGDIVEVPLNPGRGIRRVSVNWNSDRGPVAANTIQVCVRGRDPIVGATR